MLFFWDTHKDVQNRKKHGISFELAQTVFDDPLHVSVFDSRQQNEERWITMGLSSIDSLIVVAHTFLSNATQGDIVRLISARLATKKERLQYEEGI